MTQQPLFEPTGAEVGRLAFDHMRKADALAGFADVAETRGMVAVAQSYEAEASRHAELAVELAMLAEFERLGGVVS